VTRPDAAFRCYSLGVAAVAIAGDSLGCVSMLHRIFEHPAIYGARQLERMGLEEAYKGRRSLTEESDFHPADNLRHSILNPAF